MLHDIDHLALAACARGLPPDTAPIIATAMQAAILETFRPVFQPPNASDNPLRSRTPFVVLVRQAVRGAGHCAKKRKPRWSHVVDALAVGSTFAHELCEWAGVDAEELIGTYER